MKAFAVIGFSKSGKTTLIEQIIKELKNRGHSVATVKHIHGGKSIDLKEKDTRRHINAGAELTIALSDSETLEIRPLKTELWKILWRLSNYDFVVLEGFKKMFYGVKIAVARNLQEAKDLLDSLTIAFTGKLAEDVEEVDGIPVVSNVKTLVDLVEEKAFTPPAGFNCGECGYENCKKMAIAILENKARIEDCLYMGSKVRLIVNEYEVKLNPFTSLVFKNVIMGLVNSLKGVESPREVKIEIRL